MHLTAVRLFVESTLRYGLPPVFQAAVVKPWDKKENELRKVMARVFGDGACNWYWDGGSGVTVLGFALVVVLVRETALRWACAVSPGWADVCFALLVAI
jgi:hypothetical protein